MLELVIFILCLVVGIPIVVVSHKKDWNIWKAICWLMMADVAVLIISLLVYAWLIR